tara:strand:+ start:285 stop:1742 length:1458 start_codon:yes stop_codon:yes gene_type:complete
MLNRNFQQFKFQHQNKINQVLYVEKKIKKNSEILNLIDNFLSEKNSFIFESVEKGTIKGRYTIFGKKPDKIWEFNNKKSYKIQNDKKIPIKGKPQNIIENILENFNFQTPKRLPSICSLISGYFSYDTIRYKEKIPDKCNNDLKMPDVRLLRPTVLIIHDNLKRKIFYIINVFKDQKIKNYRKKYDDIKKQIKIMIHESKFKSFNAKNLKFEKKIKVRSNTSKGQFINMVKKAKKFIKIGDIFQVVLSQRFEAKLTKNPLDIYKKLRITNPSPFMFFFNFKDFQIIGASPEILVRLRDGKITIRPIAGTRPRGKTIKQDKFYAKDLLKDKKELAEHLMLLDLGRNDVGKVAKVNSVKVTEKFSIEKYSHVMHIVSNVVGIHNKKLSKLNSLLSGFPAGTVSGAPKIRAMEIIDELEKSKRKVYAGGIGYFSANGDFDTCIALRTAVTMKNKFYVQAGAGIVADSKPNKEYEETINKAKALISALE